MRAVRMTLIAQLASKNSRRLVRDRSPIGVMLPESWTLYSFASLPQSGRPLYDSA